MAKKVTTKAAETPVQEVVAETTATVAETVETPVEEEVAETEETPEEESEKSVEEIAAEIAREEAPTIEVPEIKMNTEPLEEIEKITNDFAEVKEGVEKAMESSEPIENLQKKLDKIESMKEAIKKDIAKTEKEISPESKENLKNLMQTGQFGGYWNGLYETDSINL